VDASYQPPRRSRRLHGTTITRVAIRVSDLLHTSATEVRDLNRTYTRIPAAVPFRPGITHQDGAENRIVVTNSASPTAPDQ